MTIKIPHDWKGEHVNLIWDSDSEALVCNEKGVPLQGLTGGDGNDKRWEFTITTTAAGNETYIFYIEMACNGLFGNGLGGMINEPDPNRYFSLRKCQIGVFDAEAYSLMVDFRMIADMAQELPEDSNRGSQALMTADRIINACDTRDRKTWPKAAKIAKDFLAKHNGDSQHTIYATGHCHIDVAWLWPYDETKRKCARSWSSQVGLMEKYKNYKFSQSQAQLYEWTKELYPELYEKIKQKVKTGQFIPCGGSWVEMDGILPSGESMARQFLYGQRFFKQEFGKYCTEFWLPDSFGYSGQLPQIMRQANIDCFVTQKMSWNLINKFPHSTMHWKGLDGSTVWAHFPPMDNYCSDVKVKEMLFGVSNFKNRGASNVSLCLFGYGDGGGGPTTDMLERLERYVGDIDGIPRTQLSTAQEFFNVLKKEQTETPKLETWHGELYFELHRGCYTSQASTKKGNRQGETMLHNVEVLGALNNHHYDVSKLWKLLLLNQFHDVLPGSSIGLAYVDALEYYEQIQKEGAEHVADALEKLEQESVGSEKGVLTVNTLGWERTEVVEVDPILNAPQLSRNGKDLVVVHAPALGFDKNGIVRNIDEVNHVSIAENDAAFTLQNNMVRLHVSKKDGTLSLYDKRADREVIVSGGNQFVLYDDIPLFWDAWDVEVYHLDKPLALHDDEISIKIVERGPLRATISLEKRLTATSKLQQFISLTALSARVDFETTVDWLQERHVMLKVQFPTTINNPQQQATFETQFGHLQRPTHRNTSWDWSKFEVHCQKWFDLSEYDYGLSILNDCKYGCAVLNNTMSISLLRSPKSPDEHCDMGTHKFTYSLFPHLKSYQEARVIQEAQQLNAPLLCRTINAGVGRTSLFSINTSSVIIDTVKKAEDDDSLVLRLYEAYGGRSSNVVVKVDTARRGAIKSVKRVNILEEEIENVQFQGDEIHLGAFKSFELQSIKISF